MALWENVVALRHAWVESRGTDSSQKISHLSRCNARWTMKMVFDSTTVHHRTNVNRDLDPGGREEIDHYRHRQP